MDRPLSLTLVVMLLLTPLFTSAEDVVIKLRTSVNTGYTRIVLEGNSLAIRGAIVNQRGNDVIVTFPDAGFSLNAEKAEVAYKKSENAIVLSPGPFRGMKVLSLEGPDRIVIDVYPDGIKDGKSLFTVPKDVAGSVLPETEKAVVVIDPGHGGYETGIVEDGIAEKNLVLEISRMTGALLEESSLKYSLTRGKDFFMSQSDRVRSANEKAPDVFLSIHIGRHREMRIYIPVVTGQAPEEIRPYLYNKGQEAYQKRTVALLNSIRGSAAADLGDDMVEVKTIPYSFLSQIEAAALMIELPSPASGRYTDEFRQKIVATLAKGVALYEEKERK